MNSLIVEKSDGIEIISLNRPKAFNALNWQVVSELEEAVGEAERSDSVKVIIITGSGRAFAAGADITDFAGKDGEGMFSITHHDHECFLKIMCCTKPIIAAINGPALGGGLELAMSCHIRVASETAIFGLPEISLGAIPGGGGTQLLPRLIGKGAALYHMLTGENISAPEAYRLGLIDKIVPQDKLMVTATAIARVITQKAPIAARLILEAVNKGLELDLASSLKIEEELWRKCGDTEDFQEGVKAFMEKRPVVFKGR